MPQEPIPTEAALTLRAGWGHLVGGGSKLREPTGKGETLGPHPHLTRHRKSKATPPASKKEGVGQNSGAGGEGRGPVGSDFAHEQVTELFFKASWLGHRAWQHGWPE